MKEETKEKILNWIYKNHHHHEFCDEELSKDFKGCYDNDYPYVNSLKLENFIKNLK